MKRSIILLNHENVNIIIFKCNCYFKQQYEITNFIGKVIRVELPTKKCISQAFHCLVSIRIETYTSFFETQSQEKHVNLLHLYRKLLPREFSKAPEVDAIQHTMRTQFSIES